MFTLRWAAGNDDLGFDLLYNSTWVFYKMGISVLFKHTKYEIFWLIMLSISFYKESFRRHFLRIYNFVSIMTPSIFKLIIPVPKSILSFTPGNIKEMS